MLRLILLMITSLLIKTSGVFMLSLLNWDTYSDTPFFILKIYKDEAYMPPCTDLLLGVIGRYNSLSSAY